MSTLRQRPRRVPAKSDPTPQGLPKLDSRWQLAKPEFDGEWVRLTELCKPKQWKTIPRASLKQDGYPVYGANGVIGYSDSYNHENETILVGCRGTCGQINVCRPRSYVTGNAMCLDELSEDVDLRYLEQFLRAFDFKAIISGSSQPQITRQGLSKVLVPVRPLDEQRTIADNLGKLSQLENLCERQLSAFDDLVKSQFVEMFGNVSTTCRVQDVATTYNGDRGKNYPTADDKVLAGYPFINAGNLEGGKVSFDSMDYITAEKYQALSGGKIRKDDILYCLRGSLGKSAICDFDGGTIASSLMVIRANIDEVSPRYLFEALNTPDVIRQMHAADNGSSQPNLSAKSVKSYLIPLPSKELQQQFADFVARVDKLRFEVKRLHNVQKCLRCLIYTFPDLFFTANFSLFPQHLAIDSPIFFAYSQLFFNLLLCINTSSNRINNLLFKVWLSSRPTLNRIDSFH